MLVAAGSPESGAAMVLNAASKAYAEFAETKQRAELASSYHTVMSQAQAAVDEWKKNIADTGRYMQNDQGEEVPTHTLVVESYDSLATALRERVGPEATRLNRANRAYVDQQLGDFLTKNRADALSMERSLFVSDMMATFDDNLQIYLGAGDFDGAAQMVRDYFDGGILTADERKAYMADLRNRYAVTSSQDMLAAAKTTQDYLDVVDYVQEGNISAAMTVAQRSTLIERALERAAHVDDEADDRLSERQKDNAARLESRLYGQEGPYSLAWEEISRAESAAEISPEQALGLRKARENRLSQAVDDQESIKYIEMRMFTLSEAGDQFEQRREDVIDELNRLASNRLIGGQTYGRLLGEIRQLDAQRFTNPVYRQADEYLRNAIMAIPSGFTVFADQATARKTDAYNAAAAALFRAARDGGPDFDALDWAERNSDRFKQQARPSSTNAAAPTWAPKAADGSVDINGAQAYLSTLLTQGKIAEYEEKGAELQRYIDATSQ